MKKIAILMFLVFLPITHALEITEYDAKVELSDMTPLESISLTMINTHESPVTELSYPFNSKAADLSVSDVSGEISSSSEYKGKKTFITTYFREPLTTEESYTMTYKFLSSGHVTKKENTYILSTSHSLLANVKNFRLSIVLPEGYGITEEGVSPEPVEIVSDGRKVILKWDYREPIPTGLREFRVIVLFERLVVPELVVPEIVETGTTAAEKNDIYFYTSVFLAALLILLILKYMKEEDVSLRHYLKRRRYIEGKIDILKEDEQAIMKMVIEKDGIDQREIQRETDFSKTKVSKILSELEKRGAITKRQVGRRNKIYLTQTLKEA
ncbi:MAG: winged helix-turn-helix transcriptional regulator [Candidatus Hydrothermarchaeales archaeon]